jgi:hypothetical protein
MRARRGEERHRDGVQSFKRVDTPLISVNGTELAGSELMMNRPSPATSY